MGAAPLGVVLLTRCLRLFAPPLHLLPPLMCCELREFADVNMGQNFLTDLIKGEGQTRPHLLKLCKVVDPVIEAGMVLQYYNTMSLGGHRFTKLTVKAVSGDWVENDGGSMTDAYINSTEPFTRPVHVVMDEDGTEWLRSHRMNIPINEYRPGLRPNHHI